MEQEDQDHPRGRLRLEVWLFLAMLVLGLLGFMSTLSGGEAPGGEEAEASVPAPQSLPER